MRKKERKKERKEKKEKKKKASKQKKKRKKKERWKKEKRKKERWKKEKQIQTNDFAVQNLHHHSPNIPIIHRRDVPLLLWVLGGGILTCGFMEATALSWWWEVMCVT